MDKRNAYFRNNPFWVYCYHDGTFEWFKKEENIRWLARHRFKGVVFFSFIFQDYTDPDKATEIKPEYVKTILDIQKLLQQYGLTWAYYYRPATWLYKEKPIQHLIDHVNKTKKWAYFDGLKFKNESFREAADFMNKIKVPTIVHLSIDRPNDKFATEPLAMPNINYRLWGESQEWIRKGDEINWEVMQNQLESNYWMGQFVYPSKDATWWRSNWEKWLPKLPEFMCSISMGPFDLDVWEEYYWPVYLELKRKELFSK